MGEKKGAGNSPGGRSERAGRSRDTARSGEGQASSHRAQPAWSARAEQLHSPSRPAPGKRAPHAASAAQHNSSLGRSSPGGSRGIDPASHLIMDESKRMPRAQHRISPASTRYQSNRSGADVLESETYVQMEPDETDTQVIAPRRGARQVVSFPATKQLSMRKGRLHSKKARIAALVALLCVLLLVSLGALDGFLRVSHARADASDGVRHLHNIQALLPKGDAIAVLFNPTLELRLHAELVAAEQDFHSLRSDLNTPAGTFFIAAHLPVLDTTVSSAAVLASAADEACLAALDVTSAAQSLSAVLKGGFFADSTKTKPPSPPAAVLDTATLQRVTAEFDDAMGHLAAAVGYARQADLSTLPPSLVKPEQVAQLRQMLDSWPSMQDTLTSVRAWLTVAPELLGVTRPEHLLLLLQDRSELRATGGFLGNYAVATIQQGKLQPFSLRDVYLLDRPYLATHAPFPLPSGFAWWPQPNFAMRDSNLWGDFPTSAQFSMKLFTAESGVTVQGVVAFTPVAIERALKVVGNLSIPEYGQVVTPANLEQLIHHYQLGIAHEPDATRKAFTAALAEAFLKKLHGLPSSALATLVKTEVTSLHTKDIQVYLSDSKAEALISKAGADGSITRGPGDGVTIVDANVGGNKAGQFVVAKYLDSVTLDSSGAATHHLTITYYFHATDPTLLYGPDVYKVYLRVYVPPTARLLSLDGLNRTDLGPNEIGQSDIPGRQMWGGYVLVQDGIPYVVQMDWTVPHVVSLESGQHSYQLDFQHQAGSNQVLTLAVQSPIAKVPAVSFHGVLDSDEMYRLTY